jgi:putative FmdB family regulatory protein
MPTYAYVCQACEHACEYFQSMSESPKRKCPACGALKLQRQIGGGAAILFKGSGFYQTDYRSDSYKAAEKAAADSAGGSKQSEKSSSTSGASSKGSSTKDGSAASKGSSKSKPTGGGSAD